MKKLIHFIYGDEDLTEFLCELLKNMVPIKGIIARDVCGNHIAGFHVTDLKTYHPDRDDNIPIINYSFFDVIKRDIDITEFQGKYIRLDDIFHIEE